MVCVGKMTALYRAAALFVNKAAAALLTVRHYLIKAVTALFKASESQAGFPV